MQARKVSPYIRNRCPNHHIIGRVIYLLSRVIIEPIKVSVTLLQYIYNLSMSVRQSREEVSAFTIQKLTRPIGVLTVINLINAVKLMLNQTFTAPVYIILMSILLFIVVLYISKLFIPPNSTNRLLTAPNRATRIFKRYLHLASY